jgi:hypothetical protein
VPPGVAVTRVVVRDVASGNRGAVSQRFEVPPEGVLQISTPVLTDQVDLGPNGRGGPRAALGADRAFRSARPIYCEFEVFGRAGGGMADVSAEIVVVGLDGEVVRRAPAIRMAAEPDGRMMRLIGLDVSGLPPGAYTLSLIVRDERGGGQAEQSAPFRIATETGADTAGAREATTDDKPPAKGTGELATILERAGRYVVEYALTFSRIIADEECRQVLRGDDNSRRVVRSTRGGVFFVTLSGPLPWATFRDVWEVDGNRIRDRQDRLARLFRDSRTTASERTLAILEESARYNLGPVRRTLNVPTLALLFLHPENQHRFHLELKGSRSVEGKRLAVVAFRESARPTLVRGDTAEGAPVKGTFWIEPGHGTVFRTDAEYDIDPRDWEHRSRARVVTDYREEPSLGIMVPDRMQETYRSPAASRPPVVSPNAHVRVRGAEEQYEIISVDVSTKYSEYLRFGVTTEESYSVPK